MGRQAFVFVAVAFLCTPRVCGQDRVPAIHTEVVSSFVWGEDSSSGAISSTIQDPLTGNTIHTLRYAGVMVTSRIGFERVGTSTVGTFLNYTATIVNETNSSLSVRHGGISIDGNVASLLRLIPPSKKPTRKQKKDPDMVELTRIHCFASGFIPSENMFSLSASAQVLSVLPGSALTVSAVVRDPRTYHSILCSVEGCHLTGTIRHYLTVDGKDFVFVWPGRSAIYCGR